MAKLGKNQKDENLKKLNQIKLLPFCRARGGWLNGLEETIRIGQCLPVCAGDQGFFRGRQELSKA